MLFDDNLGFITFDMLDNNSNNMDNGNMINNINNNNANNKLVTVDEGFLRGNMFKDEYVPYKNYNYGKIMPGSKQEALLLEIMEDSFAIIDLNLYLDLHPNDSNMLARFKELVEASVKKEMEYVKMYGPLELIDSDSNNTFEWINDPWPWQDSNGGAKYV